MTAFPRLWSWRKKGELDYLVSECLAERTIALAQLERSRNPALDVLRVRLASSGITPLDSRYQLIGLNSILGDALSAGYAPYEVRARAAMRVAT